MCLWCWNFIDWTDGDFRVAKDANVARNELNRWVSGVGLYRREAHSVCEINRAAGRRGMQSIEDMEYPTSSEWFECTRGSSWKFVKWRGVLVVRVHVKTVCVHTIYDSKCRARPVSCLTATHTFFVSVLPCSDDSCCDARYLCNTVCQHVRLLYTPASHHMVYTTLLGLDGRRDEVWIMGNDSDGT